MDPGLELTFWRLAEAAPGDPAGAGEGLRRIDEALTGYDGALPGFLPARPSGLPRAVVETFERAERAVAGAKLVPHHGDPHDGNCLGGLWSDFADTRRAPAAWDRACLLFCAEVDGDDWARRAAAELAPADPAATALLVRVRCALSAVWGASRGDRAHVARRVSWLERQARWM